MPDHARRDLLKQAATLSIGAMASASVALARAARASAQEVQNLRVSDFFPGFKHSTAEDFLAQPSILSLPEAGRRFCSCTAIRKRTLNGALLRPNSPKNLPWLRPISAGTETAANLPGAKTTLIIQATPWPRIK